MRKALISLVIIFGLILSASSTFAAMQLYISSDCGSCDEVLEQGKETIQLLEEKGELEVIDVTDIDTDLPALPALVDGKKVIIGTGLLEYLVNKADVTLSSELDGGPDYPE